MQRENDRFCLIPEVRTTSLRAAYTGHSNKTEARAFCSTSRWRKCQIDGFCKGLTVCVQGHKFQAYCFAIPLKGFDVVLGIRWLNSLGRVIWDRPSRTVKFQQGTTNVIWHGEAAYKGREHASLHTIVADTGPLEHWFSNEEEVFTTPGIYGSTIAVRKEVAQQAICSLNPKAPSDLLNILLRRF